MLTCKKHCQVQLQMLVTNTALAYLVYWSCNGAGIAAIAIDFTWLQPSLLLLRDIQEQYLSKGLSPTECFYKQKEAVALRRLTQSALKDLNQQPLKLVEATTNPVADSMYIR